MFRAVARTPKQQSAHGTEDKQEGPVFDQGKSMTFSGLDAEAKDSELRRVGHYNHLGRRFSLTPSCLAAGHLDIQETPVVAAATNCRQDRLNVSSIDTEEYLSCTESLQLDEELDETERQTERYIHRGRRFSLPPANYFDPRFKKSISYANRMSTNTKNDLRARPTINRPPTPAIRTCQSSNSLFWKQAGWHTKEMSKSMEYMATLEPVPLSSKQNTDIPDSVIKSTVILPRGLHSKQDTNISSGVTWETKPTHKTFSFVYNDANNISEKIISPPVTGGVVMKSLHTDQPSEPISPESEHLNHGLHLGINNNDTDHKTRSHRSGDISAPTLQLLKESWRRENEEEKTVRILTWIENEQSQRSNGTGYKT